MANLTPPPITLMVALAATLLFAGACTDDSRGGSSSSENSGNNANNNPNNNPNNTSTCEPVICSLGCELDVSSFSGCPVCSCARGEDECTTDDECVISRNVGKCCSDCGTAIPKALADAEPCLVGVDTSTPDSCRPEACEGEQCGGGACPRPEDYGPAVCMEGRCVEGERCPPPPCSLGCELALDAERCPICACARPEEQEECDTDVDCALATNAGACCSGCGREALPRTLIDADPCLVELGRDVDPACAPEGCTEQCGDSSCEQIAYAACVDNRCVPEPECPNGTTFNGDRCVPPCTDAADETEPGACVLARNYFGCCSCTFPYTLAEVEQNPCLVLDGEPEPEGCNFRDCTVVDCAQCPPVEPPVCRDDGQCDF